MTELHHGPLAGQDLSLLTAKSVLRYDRPNDVLEQGALVSFAGTPSFGGGFILIDWIGDGTNSAGGWSCKSFTYIGERGPDGVISAPVGGWKENPLPGLTATATTKNGYRLVDHPTERLHWQHVVSIELPSLIEDAKAEGEGAPVEHAISVIEGFRYYGYGKHNVGAALDVLKDALSAAPEVPAVAGEDGRTKEYYGVLDKISALCTSFNDQIHDADDVLGQINQLTYQGMIEISRPYISDGMEGDNRPELPLALLETVIILEDIAKAWPKDSIPSRSLCVRLATAINNGKVVLARPTPSADQSGVIGALVEALKPFAAASLEREGQNVKTLPGGASVRVTLAQCRAARQALAAHAASIEGKS